MKDKLQGALQIDPTEQARRYQELADLAQSGIKGEKGMTPPSLDTPTAPAGAKGPWLQRSSFTTEDRPGKQTSGETDGTAQASHNLNAQQRAQGTNVPHGPHSVSQAPPQLDGGPTQAKLGGVRLAKLFANDATPLGQAWSRVVGGDASPEARSALKKLVEQEIAGVVKGTDAERVADGIVDYAAGLHAVAKTLIRNIR